MKHLIYAILIFNILHSNPFTLAKRISNKDVPISYYYWKDDKNVFYLGKKRKDKTYSIWIYTKDRKWKPFHNTGSFDKFPKAGKMYQSVSFKDGMISLEPMNASGEDDNKNDPKPPIPFSTNIVAFAGDTKMFKIDYYFWADENNFAFLSKMKDANNTSIWHYTKDREWMPIYNAGSFDGFPAIGKTFDSVKLDPTLSAIKVGNFVNYLKDDFKLKLSSNSVGDDNYLTSEFTMKTPQFNWDYNLKYRNINEAFILQLAKEDGSLIYSTLLSKKAYNIEEGKGSSERLKVLPSSAFCEKQYENTIETDDRVFYRATIYAIYDISVTNKATCIKDIQDEKNYLVKSTLDMYVLTKNSIKVNSDLTYKNGFLEGSIVFSFSDAILKKTIKNIQEHIKITNLPSDFDIPKDLKLSHTIDVNELIVTIKKTKVKIENKYIDIEFLDTMFVEAPKNKQKLTIPISDAKKPPANKTGLPED